MYFVIVWDASHVTQMSSHLTMVHAQRQVISGHSEKLHKTRWPYPPGPNSHHLALALVASISSSMFGQLRDIGFGPTCSLALAHGGALSLSPPKPKWRCSQGWLPSPPLDRADYGEMQLSYKGCFLHLFQDPQSRQGNMQDVTEKKTRRWPHVHISSTPYRSSSQRSSSHPWPQRACSAPGVQVSVQPWRLYMMNTPFKGKAYILIKNTL
jgi:hypothetical protein